MENQVYHIQTLLVDELDNYKEKEKENAEGQIKKIQDAYKQDDQELKKPMVIDKEQAQKEEIFLYKPYDAILPKPKIPELILFKMKLITWKII